MATESVKLDEVLLNKFRVIAKAEGRLIRSQVEIAMREHLGRRKEVPHEAPLRPTKKHR